MTSPRRIDFRVSTIDSTIAVYEERTTGELEPERSSERNSALVLQKALACTRLGLFRWCTSEKSLALGSH